MRTAHLIAERPSDGTHPLVPRPLDRTLARIRAPGLDQQIADGVAPWRSRAHAARSLQLTSRRHRNALASGLERLLEKSERETPPSPLRAALPPSREQVHEARPSILTIARELRSDVPLNARGVAGLQVLLTDCEGPFFTPIRPGALSAALAGVAEWLGAAD